MKFSKFLRLFATFITTTLFLSCSSKSKSNPKNQSTTSNATTEDPSFNLSVEVTGLKDGKTATIREDTLGSSFDLIFEKNSILIFNKKLPKDSSYSVSVVIQPDGQTCSINNKSGSLISDSTITAVCSDNKIPLTTDIKISALVSGLENNKTLVLSEANQTSDLTFTGDGLQGFAKKIKAGTAYAVSIKTQPDAQKCSVSKGSGTSQTDVVVQVACKDSSDQITPDIPIIPDLPTFSLSVTVSGLGAGRTLVIRESNLGPSSNITFTSNIKSTFGTEFDSGSNYAVSVHTQPSGQTCSVSGGSGKITKNILIAISCNNTLNFAATKLSLTGAETISDGECSIYTITARNDANFEVAVENDVTADLTGKASGAFYSDSECITPITSTIISANESKSIVYYRNRESETGITLLVMDQDEVLASNSKAITSDVIISKIVSGYSAIHFCVMLSSGLTKCWGYNGNSQYIASVNTQSSMPLNIEDFFEPSSAGLSYQSSCFIKNHQLFCRGYNNGLNLNSSTTDFIDVNSSMSLDAVSSDDVNTCVLASGNVWCAGQNYFGVTGVLATGGDNSAQAPFAQISGLSNISQLQVGSNFACALIGSGDDAGKVKCWGRNFYGELGNGAGDNYNNDDNTGTPTFVSAIGGSGQLENVTQIATGAQSVCTLLINGSVNCWGYEGQEGILGDNHPNSSGSPGGNRNTPVAITFQSSKTATKVIAGYSHFCAIMDDATVQCWGKNYSGQIGNGKIAVANNAFHALTPQAVVGLSDSVIDIALSYQSSCALLSDHYTVQCWGENWSNQTGTENIRYKLHPKTIEGISSSTDLAFIADHYACSAVSGSGPMKCWGENRYGQLGNDYSSQGPTPTEVTGMDNVISMCGRNAHTCSVKSDGTLWCWGINTNYQLGNGTTTNQGVPVQVRKSGADSDFLTNITDVKCGVNSTCALDGTGQMWCWGTSGEGAMGLVSANITADIISSYNGIKNVTSFDGIAVGMSLVVRDSGTTSYGTITSIDVDAGNIVTNQNISGYPSETSKNITVYESFAPYAKAVPTITNAIKIAHTSNNSCAILADHSLKCWGVNNNSTLTNVSAEHYEPTPQLITDSGSSTFKDIAINSGHACATVHTTSGSLNANDLECWGSNTYNEVNSSGDNTIFIPTKVDGINGAIKSQLTLNSSCVLMADGIIKCWGRNNNGNIGAYTRKSLIPAELTFLSGRGAVNFFKSEEPYAGGSCIALSGGGVECIDNTTSDIAPSPVTARSIRRGPTEKVFLSGQSYTANCRPIFLGLKSSYGGFGTPSNTDRSFTIYGANPDFAFYTSNGCSEAVTSITIPADKTWVSVYINTFSELDDATDSLSVISNSDESIFTDENFDIYFEED